MLHDPRTPRMRQSLGGQRGMSMWPFVICLVLLLVFVFLWWSEKGEAENKANTVATQAKTIQIQNEDIGEYQRYVEQATRVIGPSAKATTTGGSQKTSGPDLEAIAAELSPEGTGAVKAYRDSLQVSSVKGLFTAKAGTPQTTTDEIQKLSPEFKEKLKQASDAWPGKPPTMPDDPDDAAEMAKWKSDNDAWQKKFDDYMAKLTELTKQTDFPKYKAVIGGGVLFDPDKTEVVKTSYWVGPAAATMTLAEFLPKPAQFTKELVGQMSERINQLLTDNKNLQDQVDKLKGENDTVQKSIGEVQAKLTEDTGKLQREAEVARADLEKIRVAQTSAQAEYDKKTGEHKVELTALSTKANAMEQALRIFKEKQDLSIERDDPDGHILAADNTLGIVYIDLGFADKVYAPLKFRVSYIARGAIRTTKGEIQITKVIGPHYSQARILPGGSGDPIGTGDLISNPFFDAKKTLHVYVAGDLKKYPKSVAELKLKAVGIVLDPAPTASTDFIVVPDSLAAPAATAPAEGAAPAAPGTQSDYDRLIAMARNFNATLVTERLLSEFVDY